MKHGLLISGRIGALVAAMALVSLASCEREEHGAASHAHDGENGAHAEATVNHDGHQHATDDGHQTHGPHTDGGEDSHVHGPEIDADPGADHGEQGEGDAGHEGHHHGDDEGLGEHVGPDPQDGDDHEGHVHETDAAGMNSMIAIPPAVRENLGITFVKAEHRPIHSTMRLPGEFELRPEARRAYNVMLPGRIEVKVKQYDRVKAGDELFTLDSAEWRRVQSNLAAAYKACYCCLPELEVARATKRENEAEGAYLEKRIATLTETGSRSADLERELAMMKMRTPRFQA